MWFVSYHLEVGAKLRKKLRTRRLWLLDNIVDILKILKQYEKRPDISKVPFQHSLLDGEKFEIKSMTFKVELYSVKLPTPSLLLPTRQITTKSSKDQIL